MQPARRLACVTRLTKRGRVECVVREMYQRTDIQCRSPLCRYALLDLLQNCHDHTLADSNKDIPHLVMAVDARPATQPPPAAARACAPTPRTM